MRYIRMKRIFLQGLLWLYLLLDFGYMALSLEPGFLDFDNLPDTNFSCLGKVIGGYYADLETNCQMFHVCTIGQLDEPMDIRFLCLNGTVFDQETRVCERIDEVDCSKSEQFYGLNLELYGNTQPPILEESPETDQPLVIKSTTTTTSTTTPKPKATNTPFYSSSKPPAVTTQTVGSHHFPLNNSPDIRFNPEEINISLHPGAPPDIRTKSPTYQQQSYSDNNKKVVVTTHSEHSDNKKVSVTTHSSVFDDEKVLSDEDFLERPRTQKPHSHSFGHGSHASKNFHPTPSDINFEFTFRQTEPSHLDFNTELPSFFHSDFHSDQDFAGHHHDPQSQQFKSSTFLTDYTPTTKGLQQQKVSTTVRNNYFLQSLKPPAPNQPHHYTQHQTEKPQRVQLPLPLLPTLSPLTFSTPAPFALQHHIDSKRYTKDHPSPPRIVISASASVSDASGRRLNYSLGTIGAAEFLEQPPHSYDEYKDDDVGLDPFYHDVPKIKRSRRKRDSEIKHTDIIKNEEEAINVLKFLFEWYKNNEKTTTTTLPTVMSTVPATPETDRSIASTEATDGEISAEESKAAVSKESIEENFRNSELFNKNSKFNIISNVNGGKTQGRRNAVVSTTLKPKIKKTKTKTTTVKTTTTTKMSKYEKDFLDELFGPETDYVNDNFEPIAYNEKYGDSGKETTTTPSEVVKNPSLPKDYVDDNIEPIYFRDRMHHVTKKVLDEKYEDISLSTSAHSVDPNPTKEPKEFSSTTIRTNTSSSEETKGSKVEVGDTETNNIKQNLPTAPTETTSAPISLIEPKSEILEPVTTEKSTTLPVVPKRSQRRGRKRYYTTTEKEKELENKNVVLEKITERAHTAKDDFNYLRTLYKVYTTTPTYTASETKTLEETRTSMTRKIVNDDYDNDLKEASPSDKVLKTSLEGNSKIDGKEVTQLPYLTPAVTSEATTITTEKISSSSTSEPSAPVTTATPTTEKIVLPTVTIETTTSPSTSTSPSTTTTEKMTLTSPNVSISEAVTPSNITEMVVVSTEPTERTTIPIVTSGITLPSTTTTEIITSSSTRSEVTTPSTTTTERDTRRNARRGKSRYSGEFNQSTNRRRKPEDSSTSTDVIQASSSDRGTPTTALDNIQPANSRSDNLREILVEENGSNINRIVPYPITTEYVPTNNIHVGGATKQTFLTQLALNYKKIFQDISQTAPIVIASTDVSAPTEPYRNIPSSSIQAFLDYGVNDLNGKTEGVHVVPENVLPPTTASPSSTHEVEDIHTTAKVEVVENQKSETSPNPTHAAEEAIPTTAETKATESSSTPMNHLTTETSPSPTNAVPEIAKTTANIQVVENGTVPLTHLKSESQVLQTEESATFGKTQIVLENGESLEALPTTLITSERTVTDQLIPKTTSGSERPVTDQVISKITSSTERPVTDQVISKTTSSERPVTDQVVPETTSSQNQEAVTVTIVDIPITETITEKLKEESEPVEVTTVTSSTTENVRMETTEKSVVAETSEAVKQDTIINTTGYDSTVEPTTINLRKEIYQTTSNLVRDRTTLIPRITDIFNFFRTSRDEIFGRIPASFSTTEYSVRSTEIPHTFANTVPPSEAPKEGHSKVATTLPGTPIRNAETPSAESATEDVLSTVYVVRTTEKPEEKSDDLTKARTEENVENTESYPNTFILIRTTESAKVESEKEKLAAVHQYSTKTLQKLIEEIEENTKSVVATTNLPMMNAPKDTPTTTEGVPDHSEAIQEIVATTERRDDLQELTSLFQYSTPVNILLTPKEEVTESTKVSSTTESLQTLSTTTSSVLATDPDQMSTRQIERLTVSDKPVGTTPATTTSTIASRRGNVRRGGRPERRGNSESRRGSGRHRFSTDPFTRRPETKQTIEDEIINELTRGSKSSTTESYRRRLRVRPNSSRVRESSTDAPLQKSASPTQPERSRESLPTTPLSKKHFIFNCFGKAVDKFYPDPRDCRLFHYCTQGYNKNQLIDMKFVCDLNTYFDDEKLTCSKKKPKRCL